MNETGTKPGRSVGWLLGLAIALIFAAVIMGVVAVGLIEKRKQRLYRLPGSAAPEAVRTNSAAPSAGRVAEADLPSSR